MAIELKEQRAEIQIQVTEHVSDVKSILATIIGPAVGRVNAAPIRPPLARSTMATRPIHHARRPAVGRVASSATSCVTVRVRDRLGRHRAAVVDAGTSCLAVEAVPTPLVHHGGRSACTRRVCLPVEIQGTIRTTLLDTGCEVSLPRTEFLRPGTELQSGDSQVLASNNSRLFVEGKVRLSARVGERAFFIDFLVNLRSPSLSSGVYRSLDSCGIMLAAR